MRRYIALVLAIAAGLLVWAQRGPLVHAPYHTPYEIRSVFPLETAPGEFRQVDQRQLELLADQGWELISVTPYVYRNEERGDTTKLRPIVTQTYPAYFFRRPKLLPR